MAALADYSPQLEEYDQLRRTLQRFAQHSGRCARYKASGKYVFSILPKGPEYPEGVTFGFRGTRSIDEESEPAMRDALVCAFQREQTAFQLFLPLLLKTHLGMYVALADGNLVDEDGDEIRLARRIEQGYRNRFVLIRQVCQEDTEDQLPSPEGETG